MPSRPTNPGNCRPTTVAKANRWVQAYGYVFLLSSRYPDSSPALCPPAKAPPALWLEPAEVV